MSSGWDGYAALNMMRASVIVTYGPNRGACASFAASSQVHVPSRLDRKELIAPSRSVVEEPVDTLSCRQEPRVATAPARQPSLARAESALNSFPPTLIALSFRQREVLTFIMQGRSNKEIARALDLAEGTVKIHVAALFGKLGVHRRAALASVGARLL